MQFLFDMAFTPSKPLDLRHHWKSRYLQIGMLHPTCSNSCNVHLADL